jgi:F-type H+-transporting ATPase subunit b
MATAADGAAPGMPQLDPSTFANQIFWLIVALVSIYLILTRVALPRIGAILAERRGTIVNDLASAEEFKLKAKDAEAAYDRALAEARAEAGRIADATRAAIQVDLDKAIAKADAEIAARTAESEKAIASINAGAAEAVKTVAEDAAVAVVAAMGLKADPAAVVAAVSARLKG